MGNPAPNKFGRAGPDATKREHGNPNGRRWRQRSKGPQATRVHYRRLPHLPVPFWHWNYAGESVITAHIKTLSPPDFGGFSGKAAWILSLNGREQDVKCQTGSLTYSVTTKAFRTRGALHTGFVCHSAPLKTTVESKISLDWICKPFGHLTVRRTSTTVYIMWNQLFCRGGIDLYASMCCWDCVSVICFVKMER